jgi:hypothetical protein
MGRRVSGFARRHSTKIAVAGAAIAASGVAKADDATNAGVGAITTAITALKPDIGTLILAAVGLGVLGIGAVLGLALMKRLAH